MRSKANAQQRFGKSGGSVLRRSRSFGMVNQTLVLRINPDSYRDGKNRHLRQAAKRYRQA